MNSKLKRIFGVGLPSILFTIIVYSFITYLFPFTLDDWAWGSSLGIERLTSGFVDYNGRYLGNLFVIVMTHSMFFRCLISGLVVTAILCAVTYIVKGGALAYWSAAALLLLVPESIRAQTLVWTSGFANYVISLLVVLMYLIVLFKSINETASGTRWTLLAVFTGISSALFIENITVGLVVFSLLINVISYYRNRSLSSTSIALLVGTTLGAILMFSNSSYSQIAAGEVSYRSMLGDSLLSRAISNYFYQISPALFSQNALVPILILVGMSLHLNKKSLRHSNPSFILFTLAFAVFSSNEIISYFGLGSRSSIDDYVSGLLCFIFYACVFFFSLKLMFDGNIWPFLLACCAVLITGPLLFVSPVGPRTLFAPYMLAAIWSFSVITSSLDCPHEDFEQAAIRLLQLISSICFAAWLLIYVQVFIADNQRIADAWNQIDSGQSVIEISALPFESSTMRSSINTDPWPKRFAAFYGFPSDRIVRFIE